jgi:DNA-directed RNA polymerase subunit K/omega
VITQRVIKPPNQIQFAVAESVRGKIIMNADLVRQALEKVGDPHTLINVISMRVRQLNSGGGGFFRPLVARTENQGVADVALREIIEEKIGWTVPEPEVVVRPVKRKVRGIHPVTKALRASSHQVASAIAA